MRMSETNKSFLKHNRELAAKMMREHKAKEKAEAKLKANEWV
jgi:hypothetical protein